MSTAEEERMIREMVKTFGKLHRGEIEPEPYCDACGEKALTKPRRWETMAVVWICEECDWIMPKEEEG